MAKLLKGGAIGIALVLSYAGTAAANEAMVGVYAHDVTFVGDLVGLGAAGRERGADLMLGYRTGRLEALRAIWRPQAHAFVSINSNGTSNFAAVGLNWRIGIKGPFYFRPGIGLAYTDGKTRLPAANAPNLTPEERDRRTRLYYTRIDFGSKVLFEPELALGYDISERVSLEASYTHLSHGQIFYQGKNQGLDDAGVRLIYRFGRR